MGAVTFYKQTDMSNPTVWSGTVKDANSTEITISDYAGRSGTYFGSFIYKNNSVSGILTGYSQFTDYTLYADASGFNISAASAYQLIQIQGNALGMNQLALSAADYVTGSSFSDILLGYKGDDYISAGAGDDSLDGGAGNDVLTGGAGNDAYFVDAAGDVIIELESDNTPEQQKFSMGNYNDVVIASVSYALNANAAVEDIMAAGTLTGSSKNAAINLTSNDLGQGLIGNEAKNILTGKNGDDVLVGMGGDDVLNGGAGTDILVGGVGKDIMNGGAGDDGFLFNIGSADGTNFVGNQGSIFLTGGSDTIDGGDGDGDTIVLMGTLADYTLSKTSATAYKIVANQILNGATAVETTSFKNIEYLGFISTLADLDNDNVMQVSLSSIAIATAFADTLNAPSDDPWTINGLAGNDTITGGAGDDSLDGGAGNDILTGGIGADSFKFTSALKSNLDRITDFTRGTDKLLLDDLIFTKLPAGELNANNFASTSETAGAVDYLVAKSVQVDGQSSTALFYDADGSGTKVAAIQFATLVGVTDLAASDLWIV